MKSVLSVIGLVLILVSVGRSYKITRENGEVDFRNRIVGARMASAGMNPYVTKWNPSLPETLLDPSDDLDAKYTRMTSPPTTLWFHTLFAGLDYQTLKLANFIASWIALLLISGIVGRGSPISLFLTGIFSACGGWLFHLERGQQYVYFTLFFTLAVFSLGKTRAFFSALSAAFRPVLVMTGLLSFREKSVLKHLLLTAGIGMLLLAPPLLSYPSDWWKSYFSNTRDWYSRTYGEYEKIPTPSYLYPTAVEGDVTTSKFLNFGIPGNVFQKYVYQKITHRPSYAWVMLGFFASLVLSAWILFRTRNEALRFYAVRFFASIYFCDHLLAAPRSGYNMVLYFPAVLLAGKFLVEKWGNRFDRAGALFAMIGLVFSLNSLFVDPLSSPLGVELSFLISSLLFLASPRKPNRPRLETESNGKAYPSVFDPAY